ncbi:MAG: heavy-metal-associated domain-containing protein [Chloroflexota bacterium]|nr:heavy-metal-associated domain-containing protein [Chloroflexota bacterium]
MQTKTFSVPNIGCDGCVRTIVNELSQQPGVVTVAGDKDSKIVTVQWDAPATWAGIQATLTEIDYAPALN